jgi:branched-chain amino acid transport system ATP-binding protein
MTDAILSVEAVSKNFGGLAVIDDLTFSVRRGSRTALIGPNGAGKTTVFNLITGAYPLDRGRIVMDGHDITHVPSRKRVQFGIARNFQNVRLMPHLSAIENVMVGQHSRYGGWRGALQPVNLWPHNRWRSEARAALAQAGLSDYERATVGSLPYGVQKRIELVRALMARPKLLLLDEPAAGLNPAETEALQSLIESICRETRITLLVVEHDMQFVGALCQNVIMLSFGRKIAEGSPNSIRHNTEVQKIYLGEPLPEEEKAARRRLSRAS